LRLLHKNSKYRWMLENEDFRMWLENVERGSLITGHEMYRRIGYICAAFDTTPAKLARMKNKAATAFALSVITYLEQRTSSGTNIRLYVAALKAWWAFNEIVPSRKIIIAGAHDYTRYDNETVPTQAELARILDAADVRGKVAVALPAFSGLRMGVLGDYVGRDGLKIRDLPDIEILDGKVEFSRVPADVIIRKSLSKAGHQYSSLLPAQGCEYLMQYLELRIRGGEQITPESPVITAQGANRWKVGLHITSANIGDMIRKAIRAAGFQWRPYVLRRYFDTRLMVAESEKLLIRDWRVFWMGHRGDIEHVYTLNKGRLPEDILEKMRQSFANASRYLVTGGEEKSTDKVLEAFNLQFLTIAGYGKDEIEKLGDLGGLSVEEIQKLLKNKSMEMLGLSGNRQKVVAVSEVKGWLSQGWEFISHISSDEAIIKLPS
jgi:hypothetical protein